MCINEPQTKTDNTVPYFLSVPKKEKNVVNETIVCLVVYSQNLNIKDGAVNLWNKL